MKNNEKLTIAAGIVFLGFAAIIIIALMMHFLNFGTVQSFIPAALTNFGTMLFSIYGGSSFLIPVFLFISSIMLFLPTWTFRKGIYLGISIIPFFTVVGVEKFCGNIFNGDTLTFHLIKYSAVFLISALLVAIEYLLTGIIADAITDDATAKKKESDFVEDSYKAPVSSSRGNDSSVVKPFATFEDVIPEVEAVDDVEEIDDSEVNANAAENLDINEADEIEGVAETEQFKETEDVGEYDKPDEIEVCENEVDSGTDEIGGSEAYSEIEDVGEFDKPDEIEVCENEVDSDTDEIGTSEVYREIEDVAEFDDYDLDKETGYIDNHDEIEENDNQDEFEINNDVCLTKNVSENENAVPMNVSSFQMPEMKLFDDNGEIISEFRSEKEAAFLNDPFADEVSNPVIEENEEVDEYTDSEDDIDLISDIDTDEIEIPVSETFEYNETIKSIPAKGKGPYNVPAEGLLANYESNHYWIIDEQTKQAGEVLRQTLSEFKIEAEVTGICKGPVVTMYEILPAPGVKLTRIVALQDNIALRLAAQSIRIVAPIPGKHAVGIEVPNKERAVVSFRELIEKELPSYSKMQIPVVLGKDISGDAQVIDLASTPHLLIAGSTGSGKSVCVNSMILSILYKRSPQEVKMILIDPKIVELKLYNDIPHLLTPVITEPKKAFQALQYCLCEMERRYAMLDHMGVRDIKSYNRRITERKLMQEKLPYIVVVIDEFADLMATTGKELESTVARLAAMSRAVGVHLVLATQRPSIDVITGLIKANIPSRIAFMVASKTDSRIIIDQMGAEKLLGKGDMLYASAIDPFPVRIQGTFVTEDEVENVVDFVKQYGEPEYIDDEIFVEDEEDDSLEAPIYTEGEDPLYDRALEIVVQAGKASASYIQRRLKIGYNRAARLVEEMEDRGIVGPQNGSKPREIIHIP